MYQFLPSVDQEECAILYEKQHSGFTGGRMNYGETNKGQNAYTTEAQHESRFRRRRAAEGQPEAAIRRLRAVGRERAVGADPSQTL